jgi:hypothetical protein
MKTRTHHPHPLRCLALWAALAVAPPLWAQSAPSPATPAAPSARVGDATHELLQRQREGREASATPRPIDGAVAEASHQRYMKSFEQPLPVWFGSRLQTK